MNTQPRVRERVTDFLPHVSKIHVSNKTYNWIQLGLMWTPPHLIETCLNLHKVFITRNELASHWVMHHSEQFSNIFSHGE